MIDEKKLIEEIRNRRNFWFSEVVQFNEKHKWCGCLGIVEEVKKNRIMVSVPVPEKGTAYIFARPEELERIGVAAMVQKEVE